jgi:hypothetical protein
VVTVRVDAILAQGDPNGREETVARLRVLRVIKGAAAPQISVRTASSGFACGLNFIAGQTLTIGIMRVQGKLWTDSCMFLPDGE